MSVSFNLEQFCWNSYKHKFNKTDVIRRNNSTYIKFEFYTNDNLCTDLYKIFMKYGKKDVEIKYDVAITGCRFDKRDSMYSDDLPSYETLICWGKKNEHFRMIV